MSYSTSAKCRRRTPEAALTAGDLHYPIAARYPLERIADAQDATERTGAAGRVVADI